MHAIAIDSVGNLFIADANSNRVRKVTVSTGIITTYAGNGATSFSGDGGAATSAAVSIPRGVALDSSGLASLLRRILVVLLTLHSLGNLYIVDTGSNRVRKVTVTTNAPR